MNFLKIYGDTEGPLGFPMKDADARALDALLQSLPDQEYHRVVVQKATTEISPGERADVSWIQTETIDRQQEIVLMSGFRDDQFKANPIVTLNHDYTRQPVGRSLWRRKVRDGQTRGIKATTVYPQKPDDWKDPIWAPDSAFALVKAGLLTGKSIGFLATKSHSPTPEEIKKNADLADAWRIIDEWVLVEYCCTWMPVNPDCVVEAVSKSLVTEGDLAALGIELPVPPAKAPATLAPTVVPFTPLDEISKAVTRCIQAWNLEEIAKKAVQDGLDRARGRV
jgi:hypothetical protein